MLKFPGLGARLDVLSLVAQVTALMPGEGGSVAWRLLPVNKWEVQRAVKRETAQLSCRLRCVGSSCHGAQGH